MVALAPSTLESNACGKAVQLVFRIGDQMAPTVPSAGANARGLTGVFALVGAGPAADERVDVDAHAAALNWSRTSTSTSSGTVHSF